MLVVGLLMYFHCNFLPDESQGDVVTVHDTSGGTDAPQHSDAHRAEPVTSPKLPNTSAKGPKSGISDLSVEVSQSEASIPVPSKPECSDASSLDVGLQKQKELIESIFPDEPVHHISICSPTCTINNAGKFKHSWLRDRDLAYCSETKLWWLLFVEGKGMFCLLCKKHDTCNPQNKAAFFNKTAATRFRPATLREHVSCASDHKRQQHQDAIFKEMLQRTSYFQRQIDEEKLHGDEGLVKAFNAFYFLAQEEVANCKIIPLLKLLETLGATEIATFQHRSKGSIQEVFLTIGEAITDDILEQVSSAGCIGLLCDDVTDIATLEQMLTFVQYVHQGNVQVKFLTVDNLLAKSQSANADTMLQVLEERFANFGIPMSKISSMASDGASVMMGKTGGLAAKLRKAHSPALVNIHCICHKLALACTTSVSEIKQIQNVERNLMQLWKFLEHSPKRLAIYTKVLEQQKEVQLSGQSRNKVAKRLKKACKTRWLSFDKAVKAAHDDLGSVLLCLSELSDDATADGLLKKMKNPHWVAALYVLTDVLPVLSVLSKTFQEGSVNFSQIKPSIDRTVATLKAVPEQNRALTQLKRDFTEGGRLHFLAQDITVTDAVVESGMKMQEKYVTALIANIDNRFDHDVLSVLSALNIFNPESLPASDSDEWKEYGLSDVQILAHHWYPGDKGKLDQLVTEFKLFKYHVPSLTKSAKNKTPTVSCLSALLSNSAYSSLVPGLVQIAEFALSLPVSNAWPERGASAVKRIKSRLRSALGGKMLNALMHISINGPKLQSAQGQHTIKMAVKKWQKMKNRRKVRKALQSCRPRSAHVGCQADLVTEERQSIEPTDEPTLGAALAESDVTDEKEHEEDLPVLVPEAREEVEDVMAIFNLHDCDPDSDGSDSAIESDMSDWSGSDDNLY